MTPVDATSTSSALQPSTCDTISQVSRATVSPGSPVAALALPELIATACTRPQPVPPRCERETVTGAAQNRLVVKVPAAATGRSARTRAKSPRSGFLRKPAWTPAAMNPAALVTPPSGTARSFESNSLLSMGISLSA